LATSWKIKAIAGVVLITAAAANSTGLIAAFADTRTISFFNIHTKETLTVTYKKDGKLVPDAMDKIDWIMRDWRRNEKTKMDPQTIDILWEMHTELGSKEPINIICGYRSRSTNDMLRRSVGGQASESQHITGKAIDVTFPDVPLKQMRYAALVREKGGVGYYPTSGLPFVHVDTGRVRHWPRLPRYELALLFPGGSSQHNPVDGGPITPEDVQIARSKHKDLATQIAGYFNLRSGPKPNIQVADASAVKAPTPATKPTQQPNLQVASLTPPPAARTPVAVSQPVAKPEPRLVSEPKLIERPSRFAPGPSEADRSKLMALVAFSAEPPAAAPRLVSGPVPAVRPGTARRADAPEAPTTKTPVAQLAAAALAAEANKASPTKGAQVAALDSANIITPGTLSDASRFGWGNGWVSAPAFDEEHPEELSYRPFPLAPLLTASASINDPVLSRLVAPDVAKILQLIDQPNAVPPMTFRPGQQTAEVMWAQQFQGQPVQLADAAFGDGSEDVPTNLIPRGVKTQAQKQ
jgi:uncharacterized protein YcbK (DUF882 family)